MIITVVHDSKAAAYRFPMLQESRGQAIRSWQEAANDDKTEIGKYPADFTMYQIGKINMETAEVEIHEKINLGTAIEYVQKGN